VSRSRTGITFYPKYSTLLAQASSPDFYTTPQRCRDFYRLNCQVTIESITGGNLNVSIQTGSDPQHFTSVSSLTPAALGTQQLEATALLEWVRFHVNYSSPGQTATIWVEGIMSQS
jgi:hypothetical protein